MILFFVLLSQKPDDHGTIDGHSVIRVSRNGSKAIHFVVAENPLEVGRSVSVRVDWKRRWDHMQQHSAQHLISALAEDLFSMATTSWSLGENVSSIELNVPQVSDDVLNDLEFILNEKIRASVPVNVLLFDTKESALQDARTRLELPDDHEGPIRVIHIEGIDKNTCCGTHVANLSHLQVLIILTFLFPFL